MAIGVFRRLKVVRFPQDHLKISQLPTWLVVQMRSVSAKEALRLQKEQGYVILDVRPEAEFEEVVLLWEYSS